MLDQEMGDAPKFGDSRRLLEFLDFNKQAVWLTAQRYVLSSTSPQKENENEKRNNQNVLHDAVYGLVPLFQYPHLLQITCPHVYV